VASNETITRDLEAEISAIRADLKALRGDVASAARAAGETAVKGKRRVAEAIGESADELRAKGTEMASVVEREIEQRPLTAVAVAFGAGFVLGKLLDRR
jgi:ElaB/YqjD/DUF883 family membrane-anchored ribosome-binding protein